MKSIPRLWRWLGLVFMLFFGFLLLAVYAFGLLRRSKASATLPAAAGAARRA